MATKSALELKLKHVYIFDPKTKENYSIQNKPTIQRQSISLNLANRPGRLVYMVPMQLHSERGHIFNTEL